MQEAYSSTSHKPCTWGFALKFFYARLKFKFFYARLPSKLTKSIVTLTYPLKICSKYLTYSS